MASTADAQHRAVKTEGRDSAVIHTSITAAAAAAVVVVVFSFILTLRMMM